MLLLFRKKAKANFHALAVVEKSEDCCVITCTVKKKKIKSKQSYEDRMKLYCEKNLEPKYSADDSL